MSGEVLFNLLNSSLKEHVKACGGEIGYPGCITGPIVQAGCQTPFDDDTNS